MRNHHFLTLAAALLVLGAGCAAAPTPVVQAPSAAPTPKTVAEYQFICTGSSGVTPDLKAQLDDLLKQNNWHPLNQFAKVCQHGANQPTLVVTDNCTDTQCTQVAVLQADIQNKVLKTVATEETTEFMGAAAIGDVMSWTPEAVTYRRFTYLPDGPCVESDIKGATAYEDVEVTMATGAKKVMKSCKYESCDVDTITCTETP